MFTPRRPFLSLPIRSNTLSQNHFLPRGTPVTPIRFQYFDSDYAPRQQLACRYLERTLDDWCSRPDTSFPTHQAVAVLLHIFSATRQDIQRSWSRSLDAWLHEVAEPQCELCKGWPNRSDSDREAALSDLLEIIRSGTVSWEEGQLAEQQSAEEIVLEFIHGLVRHKLLVIHRG